MHLCRVFGADVSAVRREYVSTTGELMVGQVSVCRVWGWSPCVGWGGGGQACTEGKNNIATFHKQILDFNNISTLI